VDPTIHTALTHHLTASLTTIAHTLSAWLQDTPRTLADVEQAVVPLIRAFGATLVTQVATLAIAPTHDATHPCACGAHARYQRQRSAHVTTLFGTVQIPRAYYWCRACQHGFAPADADLQLVAGSRSASLDELLALLGATQDSFAEATTVLERLTGVDLSPNSVRAATADLGAALVTAQTQRAVYAQTAAVLPPPDAAPAPATPRLYISLDGVQTHVRTAGWKELKVGCLYHTEGRPDPAHPGAMRLRMRAPSYVTTLADATTFGTYVWQEAVRRAGLTATEIVVVGDGAAWIWNIAETQFAGATQILDWYHASSYVWEAATAIWGVDEAARKRWATTQLDQLWDSHVDQVLVELEQQRRHGDAVERAITYYTNQRPRMDYARYRAQGMQIGSGSVESACKQLVTTRLKLAGMRWNTPGAEGIALIRAYLKSGRWAEAIALRPRRQRTYVRKQPTQDRHCPLASTDAPVAAIPHASLPQPSALPPELRDQIQRELAAERANHPWKRAWSVKRQRHCLAEHDRQPPSTVSP
jgi:Uncharacterised protein family (UPF0236)